jgi:nucleoid-associated protein YgaU
MDMASKERIEPTITLNEPTSTEPAVSEPTISELVQKSEALEAAGALPVVLDDSEGARAYRENVDAIVKKAQANMDRIEQEGLDNLAISARAIKPEDGTPYDSYGEPLDLNVAADMRLAQIALQDEEVSKKFLERLVKRIGPKNAATITPLAMGNPALLLTPENISDVKDIAPKYWTPEYQDLFEHMGQTLLKDAGFSKEIIDRLDPDFVRYMGVTQKHEKSFAVEGPGIAERLKDSSAKTMILDALGNKNVQRSLKWAGLVIGCATGGIVVKAGMAGSKFLLSKLAENEKVRGLCKTLEDRAISFVSTTLNVDEAKVRKNVNEAKGVAERLSGNKWVRLGGVAATIGLAFALGQIDMVQEASHSVVSSLHSGIEALGYGHDHSKVLEALTNANSVHPGVDPVAGAQNAATHGSFAAPQPPVGSGASYASYPGVDPAAGAQNAAGHGSFAAVPSHAEVAASPVSATPPVLESGAAAPTAAINEHIDHSELDKIRGITPAVNEHIDHAELDKIRGAAPQEFSAERSGLANVQGTEVKFPTDSASLGVNSGTAPAVADAASTAPTVADATATISSGAPVTHTVTKGDSLSEIAHQIVKERAAASGGTYTTQDVYKFAGQLYEANKDVIGNDPDKIFPGQVLKLDGLDNIHGSVLNHGAAVKHGVEVAANRVSDTVPFAPDVLHGLVGGTKLDSLALDGAGQANFPVPAPNFAHVGTEGVATTKDINEALKDFYTEDTKKVTDAVKVNKYASIDDGIGASRH